MPDDQGATPLDMAKTHGSPAMIAALSGRGIQAMTLDDELDEIEMVVSQCEKNIEDGTVSKNILEELHKIPFAKEIDNIPISQLQQQMQNNPELHVKVKVMYEHIGALVNGILVLLYV